MKHISLRSLILPDGKKNFGTWSMKPIFHTRRPQSASTQYGTACGKIATAFCRKRIGGIKAHTCEESLEDYFKRVTGGEGIA